MALDTSFELVVGGERVTANERFPVLNPANESIIASQLTRLLSESDKLVCAKAAREPRSLAH